MSLDRHQRVQRYLDDAQTAFNAGLYEEALRHLQDVIRLEPDHAPARLLQARIALRSNNLRQAIEALNAHDLYHPDEVARPDTALLRAEALVRYGLDDLAQKVLEELNNEFRDDVRPYRLLAGLYQRNGQTTQAITALQNVVRLEPSDMAARGALARLVATIDPEEGIRLLTANAKGDTPAPVMLEAARLYQHAARYTEAETIYQQLIVQAPEDADVWLEAGTLADAMGAEETAVKRLERALVLRPDRDTMAALALTHMHAGRLATAGRWWWRITRTHDIDTEAWAGITVCALAMGRKSLVNRVRRVFDVHTSRQERRTVMAGLWHHAAIGRTILSVQGDQSLPVQDQPSTLLTLLHSAIDTFTRHAEQYPDRADTHYHLAIAEHAVGDDDDAHRQIDAALSINPNYTAAKQLAFDLGESPRLAA